MPGALRAYATSAEPHTHLASRRSAPSPSEALGALASPPSWLGSRRRQLSLVVAAVVLVVVGAVCAELLRIRDELDAGVAALRSLELTEVEQDGGLATTVDSVADHLDEANRIAHESLSLRALSVLPGFSGQIDGLQSLTEAVAGLGVEAREAGVRLEAAIDGLDGGGAGRLALVNTTSDVVAELLGALDAIRIDDRPLVPPLAAARDTLLEEVAETTAELTDARRATTALSALLTGPRRYLIAVGNNAEMRSLGAVTASGVMQITGGELEVGPFLGNVEATIVREGIELPEEFAELYGWRGTRMRYPGTLYTPNFPAAAEVMASLSAQNAHGPVDGILYVDAVTLASILQVIGPVVVDGRTYAADDVIEQLLFRNYLEFRTVADSEARKSLQSEIATAAFDALNTRDYSVFELAETMTRMARSRHFLGWSQSPTENALWQLLGADGHTEGDDIFVEVGNLGASKLDYFVTVDVDLETEAGDYRRQASLTVTITNPVREVTSPYIEGFSPLIESPGEHVGWLLFFLPQYARNITAVDFPGFGAAGPDGPLYAAGVVVHVPVGESRTYTISFDLPILEHELTILPSARLHPTTWTIDGVGPLPDFVPFAFNFESGEISPSDRTPDEPGSAPGD